MQLLRLQQQSSSQNADKSPVSPNLSAGSRSLSLQTQDAASQADFSELLTVKRLVEQVNGLRDENVLLNRRPLVRKTCAKL